MKKPLKSTLDKDLDKFSLIEAAAQQVTRSYVSAGMAMLFLVLVMALAGAFAIGRPGAAIIIAAAALGGYMAMNVGANDVTNNVGPAVGARAMSMRTALLIAAACEIAGALIAGGDVVATISEDIIDPAAIQRSTEFTWAMMAALAGAALWINLATFIGAPVSTTHAIVGGVVGSGVAAAGLSAISWPAMAGIVASWLISPLIGALFAVLFLAFIKAFIIYRTDKIAAARRWVPVLVGAMAGAFGMYLTLKGLPRLVELDGWRAGGVGMACGITAWALSVPLVRRQAEGLENRNQSLRKLFRLPLIGSAALLSFAHGANDVSNAIGPLTAIVHAVQDREVSAAATVPLWVMLTGAIGISVGLMLFGPRLIRLVGGQITKLNPMRAYCVALSAALTVIVASWFGLPVSSTHIAVGAVFGVGFFREWYIRNSRRRMAYMRRRAGAADVDAPFEINEEELRRRYLVRRSHFMTIVAAWAVTVPAAATLAGLLYGLLTLFFI